VPFNDLAQNVLRIDSQEPEGSVADRQGTRAVVLGSQLSPETLELGARATSVSPNNGLSSLFDTRNAAMPGSPTASNQKALTTSPGLASGLEKSADQSAAAES
jgi:hypothetical protein